MIQGTDADSLLNGAIVYTIINANGYEDDFAIIAGAATSTSLTHH